MERETAQIITDYMIECVESGTGRSARVSTITVAGKTGTAEKTLVVDGRVVEGTDGFLIAFGPYESPKIAITVVIENAGSGSSTAQVAADIFDYYFSTLDYVSSVQTDNTVIW